MQQDRNMVLCNLNMGLNMGLVVPRIIDNYFRRVYKAVCF